MGVPYFLDPAAVVEALAVLWGRAIRPARGFQDRCREAPPLRASVRGLLLLNTPLAFLGMVLSYLGFQGLYGRLADPGSAFWAQVLAALPEPPDPQALREALAQLPALPGLARALPALVLLAPVVVLGEWLHDATFDHLGLWLLGGLKLRRGFRASLAADAEALKVAALGAAVGLVGKLPGAGCAVPLLLAPVAVYFWLLRGHALAAWHGCPAWKGLAATVLNVVLAVAMVLALLALCCVVVLLLV